jgi:hypothetical protein
LDEWSTFDIPVCGVMEADAPSPSAGAPAPSPVSASEKVCDAQLYSPQEANPVTPTPLCLQAAAAARIADEPDIFEAAKWGNLDLVKDHVTAEPGCVHKTTKGGRYGTLWHSYQLCIPFQLHFEYL